VTPRDVLLRSARTVDGWHTVAVSTSSTSDAIPVLVYDGDCAFCTRSVRFIERRISRHPRIVAWQHADLEPLGLTAEMCETAVQWVGTDGSVASGHRAVARTLIHGGGLWWVMGRIILLPGISSVSALVYRWVARNRHRMPGGTAECVLPQAERTPKTGGGDGSGGASP